jgi:hypothetical protein
MDDLDIIWQDYDFLEPEETEDEMIARISRWRKSKHEQRLEEGLHASPQLDLPADPEDLVQKAKSLVCSRQEDLLQESALGSVVSPGETQQLRETLSRRSYHRPRESRSKTTMTESRTIWSGRLRSRTKATKAEDQTNWCGRLRSRHSTIGTFVVKPKAAAKPTDKPKGIIKQYDRKALKTTWHPPTKGYMTKSMKQKADGTRYHFDEVPAHATPASIAKSKGTKNVRRQSACTVQPQGVQKAYNSKRQSGAFKKKEPKHTQELLHPLTPPQP